PVYSGYEYFLPKIRERPFYANFINDGQQDSPSDNLGAGCPSKEFDKETKKKRDRTGGVFILWCLLHGFCLGFHLIPNHEGRNDFFSVLFCHFLIAPDIIVYDYACQLHRYCMAREYQFFRKSLFLTDELHGINHVSCSAATLLAHYMATNPSYYAIRSSLCEVGNLTVKKIEKSLSFMHQEQANRYLRIHLLIHNRI
ncbi:hypothetical protein BT69DRAFT_1199964, partial [Atractiella rhizophila]